MTPKRIGLVGFDRVTALHLIGPADAFFAAVLDDGFGNRIPCYEVWTVGAKSTAFQAESGLSFTAQATLETAPEFDTIIVAGGGGIREAGTGEQIAEWLLRRAAETRRLGAICSGIFALASTGLLDGREATTHWRLARLVAQRFPLLKIDPKKPYVRDGCYYTSNGLSGGTNLALAMIQEDYGPHLAHQTAHELALSLAPQHHGSAASDIAPVPHHTTDRFANLIGWIMRNLHADLSVKVLARRACMSQDHFSKAFKSVFGSPPSEFVQNLRLHEARRRLSTRQKTVQSVAVSVGLPNTSAFQRAFSRRFGKQPGRFLEESRVKPELLTADLGGASAARLENGARSAASSARVRARRHDHPSPRCAGATASQLQPSA